MTLFNEHVGEAIASVGDRPPTQNPNVGSPPAILEWGILLSAAIAGIGYFGKWILEQSATKERSETDLMRGLIDNLQTVQTQLIKDSKEAKLELISHIDLKDTMSRMATLVKDDVGRAFGSQAGMYAEGLKNQTRMESKLDAILRQNDEIKELNQEILELLKNANS